VYAYGAFAPRLFVTTIGADPAAPGGTTTVSEVAETTVNTGAGTPPIVTDFVPTKLVPSA